MCAYDFSTAVGNLVMRAIRVRWNSSDTSQNEHSRRLEETPWRIWISADGTKPRTRFSTHARRPGGGCTAPKAHSLRRQQEPGDRDLKPLVRWQPYQTDTLRAHVGPFQPPSESSDDYGRLRACLSSSNGQQANFVSLVEVELHYFIHKNCFNKY